MQALSALPNARPQKAMAEAKVTHADIDAIAYTKGMFARVMQLPSSGSALAQVPAWVRPYKCAARWLCCVLPAPTTDSFGQVGALVARTLSLMWNKPIIGVNHCVARTWALLIIGA